ncbi:MAG TPA: YbhB/YbcL family Raf kinase inhibitor-like protein [Candidatus Caenarcaniphilales bacterium]
MKLESNSFAANGEIPTKYTCDGEDISPDLRWNELPSETQSLALIVDDPDAPGGTFVHWVVYDLPPQVQQLQEGVAISPTPEGGGVQGQTSFERLGYGGPCPPSGTHRYYFKLYALDQSLRLKSGATKSQVTAAMEGHILATAELMGRYSRQR